MDSSGSFLYSWQVHPARERWKAALLTAGVIALAAWLVAEIMQMPAWGSFAAFVLVVGCNRFFFPTRYELTAEGITARFPLKTVSYQWPELRRFVYDQTGGFLSPRARRSFLDEYRGVSLLFGESQNKGLDATAEQSSQNPLTLTLSPQGRGDKAEEIIRHICRLLPKEALIRGGVAGVDRREPRERNMLGAPLRSNPSHPSKQTTALEAPKAAALSREEPTSCGG